MTFLANMVLKVKIILYRRNHTLIIIVTNPSFVLIVQGGYEPISRCQLPAYV